MKIKVLRNILTISIASLALSSTGVVYLTSYGNWKGEYNQVYNANVAKDLDTLNGLEAKLNPNSDFFNHRSFELTKDDFIVNGIYGGSIVDPVRKQIESEKFNVSIPNNFYSKGGLIKFTYGGFEDEIDLTDLFPTYTRRIHLLPSNFTYSSGLADRRNIGAVNNRIMVDGFSVDTDSVVTADNGCFKIYSTASQHKYSWEDFENASAWDPSIHPEKIKYIEFKFKSSEIVDFTVTMRMANGFYKTSPSRMEAFYLRDLFDISVNGENKNFRSDAVVPGLESTNIDALYETFHYVNLVDGTTKVGENVVRLTLNYTKAITNPSIRNYYGQVGDFKISEVDINAVSKQGDSFRIEAEDSHITGCKARTTSETGVNSLPTLTSSIDTFKVNNYKVEKEPFKATVVNGPFKTKTTSSYLGRRTLKFNFLSSKSGTFNLKSKIAGCNWNGAHMNESFLNYTVDIFANNQKMDDSNQIRIPSVPGGTTDIDTAYQTFFLVDFGTFNLVEGINTFELYFRENKTPGFTGNYYSEINDFKIDYFQISIN